MGDNGTCAAPKGAQELLVEFQLTGSQAPFEEIARRYAGMVYNVALRVTHDAHDAEDATQATFLTLAVHAKTAGKIRYVGPWLKKVSHRLALDIRRSKKRRRAREERHANGNGHMEEAPASQHLHAEELRAILRDEIDKLPAKYRMPLILYYFGGLSPEEMSKELQCNTSTLGVRLHRGRKMLGESLSGRGITLNAAIVAAVLGGLVDSFIKDNFVHQTAYAASQVGATGMMPAGLVSMNVVSLMRVASRALAMSRVKAMVAVAVLVASTLTGAGAILNRMDILPPSILRQFNLSRLIRPLFDRLLPLPKLNVNAILPPGDANIDLPDNPMQVGPFDAGALTLSLGQTWSAASADPPGQRGSAAVVVGSNRTMAARFQMPDDLHLTLSPQITLPSPDISAAPPIVSPSSFHPQASFALATPVPAAPVPSASLAFSRPSPEPSLIVDDSFGKDRGTFTVSEPLVRMNRMIVGERSTGQVIHNQGRVELADQLVIGDQPGSSGTYNIGGTAVLVAPQVIVGRLGSGTVVQSGGSAEITGPIAPANIVIAQAPASDGAYVLNDGTLHADSIIVGREGKGTLQQDGGQLSAAVVTIGQLSGSQGEVSLNSGTFSLVAPTDPAVYAAIASASPSPMPPPTPAIIVGSGGSGTLTVSPADSGNGILEADSARGSSLYIRSTDGGDGTLRGTGTVQISGTFVQNGKVIADGAGKPGALDISSAARVTNTIDNPADGTNGWYAKDGGSLTLPSIRVNGTKFYTWGEETFDDSIDLVNSVRLRPDVAEQSGSISISLLDPQSNSAPALPQSERAVGLWSLSSDLDISSLDLIIRYDDAMISALGGSDADLGLWVFEDGGWTQITDSTLSIDVADRLISGSILGDPSYFATALVTAGSLSATSAITPANPTSPSPAVSITPEPSSLLLLAFGAAGMLVRRRRRL